MHTFSNYSHCSTHFSNKCLSTLSCDDIDCGDPCGDNNFVNDCDLLHEEEASEEV